MKILFDFEIDESLGKPPDKTTIFFSEMKKFLRERFRPLEEEIDSLQKEDDIAIVVLSMQEDGLVFMFHNISHPHSAKLLDTVTTDDLNYLINAVERKVKKGNDGSSL